MTTLALYLPFPPSTNTYYRTVSIGGKCRPLISKAGRAYREAIIDSVKVKEEMEGELTVTLLLHPPDRRRRDIDNYSKALLDGLTHAGLWGDDYQIKNMSIQMGEPNKGNPHAAVIVSSGENHDEGTEAF